tara:strand:+ start:11490 stop:13343 length:1854 start_codon:yes stop_codon:yes gene_type:complete
MKLKSNIHVLELNSYEAPRVYEERNQDFVSIGENNNYYQYIIDRYIGSTTNHAILNGVTAFVYGHGLDATDSSEKPDQYAQMKSLIKNKDLFRVVQDFIILGEGAFQITYNTERKIDKITYFPRQTLRAEKCNDKGEIEGYYYHPDWKDYNRNDKLKRIPVFGTSKELNELFIVKKYVVGFHYYSLPSYAASMPYAFLEEQISAYLINETQNSFSGTKVVNFNSGIPDKEKQIQIKDQVLGKLTGSIGDKVIVAFNANQESATTIQDISLDNAPEHYAYLSEECVKKLMVGHRITSPLLLGIRESGGGLGNNAEEIQTSTDLFLNIVIKPAQDIVIDALDDILSVNDITLNLYFKTLKPLDFMDDDTDLTDDQTEEETGIKQEDIDEEKVEVDLAEEELKLEKLKKEVLGSLAETGVKMSEDYEYVDALDADSEYSNEDWANYLIKEKKSTLSKIKGILGLNQDYVNNKPNVSSRLDSKNGLYKIRYKYAKGMSMSREQSSKSRAFCKEMMALSRYGIVWRLEDIDNASYGRKPVNATLRHQPSIKYDIFTLKGGVYCKHIFKKVLFRLKSGSEPSNNLDKYRVTKTIPKSYLKNPVGSKKAAIATHKQAGQGRYPK